MESNVCSATFILLYTFLCGFAFPRLLGAFNHDTVLQYINIDQAGWLVGYPQHLWFRCSAKIFVCCPLSVELLYVEAPSEWIRFQAYVQPLSHRWTGSSGGRGYPRGNGVVLEKALSCGSCSKHLHISFPPPTLSISISAVVICFHQQNIFVSDKFFFFSEDTMWEIQIIEDILSNLTLYIWENIFW